MNALRLSTCPRNATKDVTKDISISFAITLVKICASVGVKEPYFETRRPYLGLFKARPRKIPENTAENKQIIMIVIETQV